MDAHLLDWLGLLLRWFHMIVGIGWIGTSFYFIWLDLSLRRRQGLPDGVSGESWMVHGGGFYLVQKYTVAPTALPEELHWFKYEAYLTWVSGMLLLAVVYYWGARAFLIDTSVLALQPWMAIAISLASLLVGWAVYEGQCRSRLGRNETTLAVLVFLLGVAAAYGYAHLFSGRAAFIHVGALLGTIMAFNVFAIIIPNQKKVIAALIAGEAPDPALGEQAKQRSTHNNYLTLPVLFMMISNHYPMTFGHQWNWVIAVGVLAVGGAVRHFLNLLDAGKTVGQAVWPLPVAAALTLGLVWFSALRPDAGGAGEEIAVGGAEAFAIVQTRCASCHSASPRDADFDEAPAGVMFDTPDQLRANATRVLAQAVLTNTMPLGNKTEMTDTERTRLGAWIRQGTPE